MFTTEAATSRGVQEHDISKLVAGEPETIGRYRVCEKIGEGGMGAVYLAQDLRLGRLVAIKLVLPGTSSSQRARDRALREARALAKLQHPNVVALHEAGEFDGQIYLAMEYVRGDTLAAWVEKRALGKRGAWRDVVARFVEAGRGIAAAHDQGIVHRDIKPENIVVDERDGRAKVLDFGLALASPDEEITWQGSSHAEAADQSSGGCSHAVTGTPGYIAPEIYLGDAATEHSDQYSFCVALWRALCGDWPPNASVPCDKNASGATSQRSIPRNVRGILLRGLAREPIARWHSMHELVLALEHARSRRFKVTIGLVASLGLGAALAFRLGQPTLDEMCSGGDALIARSWNEDRGDKLRQQITHAVARGGETVAKSATNFAADYANTWLDSRRFLCEEHLRAERADEEYTRALACFSNAQTQFEAVLLQLDGSKGALVPERADNAAQALAHLPALSLCLDRSALLGGVDQPADPKVAADAAAIRQLLAQANALVAVGDYAPVPSLVEQSIAAARGLGHEGTLVDALAEAGRMRRKIDDHRGALVLLEEGVDLAEAGRFDFLAAQMWSELLWASVRLDVSAHEGEQIARRARASVRRVGSPVALQGELARAVGLLENNNSQYVAAQQSFATARDIALAAGDRLTAASDLRLLSAAAYSAGNVAQARTFALEARELLLSSLGPDHPQVVELNYTLGVYAAALGDNALARELYESALEVHERNLNARGIASSEFLGKLHHALAALCLSEGKLETALEHALLAQDALELNLPPGHRRLGDVANLLGNIYFDRSDYGRARVMFEKTHELWLAHFAPTSFEMLILQLSSANVRRKLGDHATARRELLQVHDSLSGVVPQDHIVFAYVERSIGETLLEIGDKEAASAYLREALARHELNPGNEVEIADLSRLLREASD